jgi:DNA polymerase delta subunit 3
MLYDFHSKQNAKKPQSIHATYILSGIKRKEDLPNGEVKKDDDGDDYMQSSPMMSSSIPMPEEEQKMTARPPTLSITLVREEDLESMFDTMFRA